MTAMAHMDTGAATVTEVEVGVVFTAPVPPGVKCWLFSFIWAAQRIGLCFSKRRRN
uniref:Uncharacterized protein n=1 Tax=Rhizophora mucronata TaxID=61149 RepID=A0A2P2QQX1_RHIMU